MPIPWFRYEALHQLLSATLSEGVFIRHRRKLSDDELAELVMELDHFWHERCAHRMEPVLHSLLTALLADPRLFDPRRTFGETFVRLSRYLLWVRYVVALEVRSGRTLSQAQMAEWETAFIRCGAEALGQAEEEGLTSDFYLLKGLALL